MKRILFFTFREIKALKKSKVKLFLLFLWPLLVALLLGGVFSQKVITKMPIAVIDEDQSSLSRTLIRFTSSSRSFAIDAYPKSIVELEDLMYAEKIVAGIYIPRNFEQNVKLGHGESVTLYVNGANLATANLSIAEMKVIIATLAGGVKLKLLRKLGYSKDKALAIISPIKMDITKNFNPGTNYLNYMPPGTWMAVLHQLILLFASLLIIQEKEKMKWHEILSLSQGRPERILLGKLLPYLLFFIISLEVFYLLVFPFFSIEFKGSQALMLLVSSVFVFCTLSLGLLISTTVKRSVDAIKGVLLIGSPAFIVSGYSWPRNAMPEVISFLSGFIPLTHFLEAYRKIYQQGATLTHVKFQIFILFFYGLLCLCVSYFLIKKKECA